MERKNYLKPIVKWVGGKSQLLDEILPRIAPFITPDLPLYAEPFVGGGAVLFALKPQKALLNDFNPELINVYKTVRDNPHQLIEKLQEHQKCNSLEYFMSVRFWDREPSYSSLPLLDKAARFIYLNKTCFNGLYRVNKKGQMNVPYGKYKNPTICNIPAILELSEYLSGNVEMVCGNYASVLAKLPKGSFVYLDPPYMPLSQTSSFTSYTQMGFGLTEQTLLRDECLKLRERGVRFLQSNSDCELIRDLYKGFQISSVSANRAVNSKGDKRGPVAEVLIS